MTAITVEQSNAHDSARGHYGEQDDDPTYCDFCFWVTDPDELYDLDGQQVCRETCLPRLVSDLHDADRARDL